MPSSETQPYESPDAFFAAVDDKYNDLSKRLQSIARELHYHRDSIVLMNVTDLAAAIDVAPSALIRFAQSMGFSGFSQMKSLFQQDLAEQLSDNNYIERIRQINKDQQAVGHTISGSELVHGLIDNHTAALQNLFTAKLMTALSRAAEALSQSRSLWLMGAGRSFSGASYLTYLMRSSNKPLHWLNGVSFDLQGRMNAMTEEDLLLVISYAPYAEVSRSVVKIAQKRGAKIIAITDSHLGEVATSADIVIEVRESSSFGFRSLVNTVCVLQSLFLLYASQTNLINTESESAPETEQNNVD